jgi:hypothetical protein
MLNALDMTIAGALVFNYADALKDRPLGRGFGLIDDDIHALIEPTRHINTIADAQGVSYDT